MSRRAKGIVFWKARATGAAVSAVLLSFFLLEQG